MDIKDFGKTGKHSEEHQTSTCLRSFSCGCWFTSARFKIQRNSITQCFSVFHIETFTFLFFIFGKVDSNSGDLPLGGNEKSESPSEWEADVTMMWHDVS